jgi:hypothetical protein
MVTASRPGQSQQQPLAVAAVKGYHGAVVDLLPMSRWHQGRGRSPVVIANAEPVEEHAGAVT